MGGLRIKIRSNLTIEDWDRLGGVYCSQCRAETLRIIDGLCPECWWKAEVERVEKLEDKTMRRYYRRRLQEGTISLSQMREGRL